MIIVTSNTDGIYATMDEQEEIQQPKEVVEKQGFNLWEWVKAISTLVIVGVFSFKVYQTPIALTVDFPTLLSLLLGFFSVGLAALFYFKATDTSNAFYDNTNKFTKDIAQLLAKIEAGFGERLKNIEDSNTSARDQLFQLAQKKQVLESEIEVEENEVERVKAEKDKIIDDLIQKADMTDEERSTFKKELQDREEALALMTEKLSVFEKKMKQVKGVLERRNHQFDELSQHKVAEELENIIAKYGIKSFSALKSREILKEYLTLFESYSDFTKDYYLAVLPMDIIRSLLSINYINRSGEITEQGKASIKTYIDSERMNKE